MPDPEPDVPHPPIDWEAFYRDYRKPGYVPGYEIRTQLGSGAFGIVFKANKESIGKPYAIKFLKVDDVETRAAILRELDAVRLFAQVDHPNLVSIEDQGEVDGIPYIVMAFAGDDTLRRRIDSDQLTRANALAIFEQMCRGVQALHDHSLVHFDIKPANVYLRGDLARIGDYGLSKLVTDSRNSLSMGRGTPYYMAPELLRRKGDARSDIYALGVVLYEMLCGAPPFVGDSEWEVLRKHEEQEPSLPDSLDDIERAVLARALAKDPAQRFRSVADMVNALRRSAPPPTSAPRPEAEAPRREHRWDHPARPRRGPPAFVKIALIAFGTLLALKVVAALRHSQSVTIAYGTAATSRVQTPRTPDAIVIDTMIRSEDRLGAIAEAFGRRDRARMHAIIESTPRGYSNDALYARAFAQYAGDYLPDLLKLLDALSESSDDAAFWHELLRREYASVRATSQRSR